MPQSSGQLKFWSPRGFGFVVRSDNSGAEDYVHASAIDAAGINSDSLKPGVRLAYDLEHDVKRNNMMKAVNVSIID
jgi:cold shock CspA family protein